MIDLVKLHHVSFAIRDLEVSKRFFGGVWGLPEIDRPGFQFSDAWYAIGDRKLHLRAEPSDTEGGTGRLGRSDHVAMEVRDIEAVKKTLDATGIEYVAGGSSNLGIDQIFCRDPDGHVLEFVYYHDN